MILTLPHTFHGETHGSKPRLSTLVAKSSALHRAAVNYTWSTRPVNSTGQLDRIAVGQLDQSPGPNRRWSTGPVNSTEWPSVNSTGQLDRSIRLHAKTVNSTGQLDRSTRPEINSTEFDVVNSTGQLDQWSTRPVNSTGRQMVNSTGGQLDQSS